MQRIYDITKIPKNNFRFEILEFLAVAERVDGCVTVRHRKYSIVEKRGT